jgi:hypothetical protein
MLQPIAIGLAQSGRIAFCNLGMYDALCVGLTPQLWETTIGALCTLVVEALDARQLILRSFPEDCLPLGGVIRYIPSNSSHCKRQLSRSHLATDSGIDQMGQ